MLLRWLPALAIAALAARAAADGETELLQIGFGAESDGGRLFIWASQRPRFQVRERPGLLVIELADTLLRPEGLRPLLSEHIPTPVRWIRPHRTGGSTQIEICLRDSVRHAVQERTDALVLALSGGSALPCPPRAASVGEGYRELEAGDACGAAAQFQGVLCADPESVSAREGLARAYLQADLPAAASRQADEWLVRAPEEGTMRGRWLEMIAQIPARRAEAIERHRALAAASPGDLALRLRLAELLSWTDGRVEEAVAEYRRAVEIDRGSYQARIGLARTLSWSGKTAEASQRFESLIAERPDDADALLGRGQIARWDGDLTTARLLLERARAVRPGDLRIQEELARIPADLGAPTSPPTGEDVRPLGPGWATRRAAVKLTYGSDSTPAARLVVALPVELYPRPSTRLRIYPAVTRFGAGRDQLDRFTLGAAVRQGFPLGLRCDLVYRAHLAGRISHQLAAQVAGRLADDRVSFLVGARQRPIADPSGGYEDVAFFEGAEAVNPVTIREQVEVREGFLGLSAGPIPGMYLYAQLTLALLGTNLGRTVAAGTGIDLLKIGWMFWDHSLTLKYDFFALSWRKEDPRFFSPAGYQDHAVGLEWRSRILEATVVGAEGGMSGLLESAPGFIAGAFFGVETGSCASLEGRVRTTRSPSYQTVSATVGAACAF